MRRFAAVGSDMRLWSQSFRRNPKKMGGQLPVPCQGTLVKKPGAATRSPPLLYALLGDFLHGKAFDDVAWPMKTGVFMGA